MLFEHKLLYGSKGERAESGTMDASRYIPEEDYTVPIGKAQIVREGSDVSIFSTLLMLHRSLAAAEALEKEGVSCEVIDLRTLVPLDKECVLNSVRKTGRAVVVEESPKTGGWGAQVASMIAEEASEDLVAPIRRVASLDTPVPFSPVMENHYAPSVEKIRQAIAAACSY
jgi:pyruvate dehydrogenase E1 component beta subunit